MLKLNLMWKNFTVIGHMALNALAQFGCLKTFSF